MPTIAVDKVQLYQALGKEYTTEEFEDLCFAFGLELDEDTTNQPRPFINGVREPPQLKIEVPANRYDMVCFEGIALNFNVFLGRKPMPIIKCLAPQNNNYQTMVVMQETVKIRPLISCSILRGIKFSESRYNSFISLQDKLHSNLARNRTLVSIGTHDLDVVQGPFSYEAIEPQQIQFVPLNQTKKMNGIEVLDFCGRDKHLRKFVHIIKDSPVFPVIYDSNRTVLSLPPLINSNHSKITSKTRNVLIEITATDKTKLEILNNIICSMFSTYCNEPFTVEPVKIISPHNKETRLTPDLTPRQLKVSSSTINSICGVNLDKPNICELLGRMGLTAKVMGNPDSRGNDIDVLIPPTRADILHEVDIVEDVAVAYGFNSLPREYNSTFLTLGAELPINQLSDVIRLEAAQAGWVECMPLVLCSRDENFLWMNRVDMDHKAIKLANPKSAEYQIVRTSLLPGLLKTLRENKHRPVPIKIFEVGDIAIQNLQVERKAVNERHFAAVWCSKTSGFEMIHGLLDRIMMMLGYKFLVEQGENLEGKSKCYWIEEIVDPTFLSNRAACIKVYSNNQVVRVGDLGVLHPQVLKKFEIPYTVSSVEINIELTL